MQVKSDLNYKKVLLTVSSKDMMNYEKILATSKG